MIETIAAAILLGIGFAYLVILGAVAVGVVKMIADQ